MTTSTDHTTEAQAIVDVATRATTPTMLDPGNYYVVNTPTGLQRIDLTGPEYTDDPGRKTGTTTVRDNASFMQYYGKHADENTEVYADADHLRITAVLDAHTGDLPRWEQHRLVLALRTTDAWKAWLTNDGQLLPQERFAEFIEDHLPELLEPSAAEMLEIAQSIQAATKVDFQSGTRLATGERQFKFVETIQAKAGQRGELTIPESFVVGLVPFSGSEGYRLTARLRYRITDGALRIGYKLQQPGDVLAKAFEDVRADLDNQIGEPVMNGSPAS